VAGEKHAIHWNWTGDFSSAKLEYSTDGGTIWNNIVTTTTNDGSYSWTVPNAPSAACKVRVSNAADAVCFDASNSNFTIGTTPSPDSVAITSPMGNDIWIAGRSYIITWSSSAGFTTVRIDYSTNGGSTWQPVTGSTANDGTYEWMTVPTTPDDSCKVKIASTANPSIYDTSGLFVIAPQAITVTSPEPASNWIVGRHYDLTWNWTGGFTTARIDYSTDNGSLWNPIIGSTTNDGSYEWTVPNTPSDSCRARIANQSYTAAFGISDSFAIVPQEIDVVSPERGAKWFVGRGYYVAWIWTGAMPSVKIDYSTDGGSLWNPVVGSTTNNGSYLWTIPNTPSANCRTRAMNTANNAVFGISDSFEIKPSLGVEEDRRVGAHLGFHLFASHPNPFSTTTAIQYSIGKEIKVTVQVFDITGRLLKTLVDQSESAGHHSVIWDGKDGANSVVPDGIYFCRLDAGETSATGKMIRVR
jgi:hypothetical protein